MKKSTPMNMPHCDLAPEELVAFQDDELDAARHVEVELHVAQCPICREHMEVSRHVRRIFERAWPLEENPAGQAWTIARIHELHTRTHQEPGRARKTLVVVTPMLAVALLLVVLWPAPGQADSGFAGLINATRQHVGQTVDTRQDLPDFPTNDVSQEPVFAAPEELPLDLVLVHQEQRDDGGVRLRYANPERNLELLVNQGPRETWEDTLVTEDPRFIEVNGTEVAWAQGPREETVSALLWERHNTVTSILVLRAPTAIDGGLELQDALTLVETLIEEQNPMPGR